MDRATKYFAFISYKREDEKWAKWLQKKLEHYKLPSNLNGRDDLPKEIRPIFRDQSDLSGGVLADEINQALENSKYLIVVCSPRAAQSEWVGKEVQSFIDSGRSDKIIPFIIGGTAYSKVPEDECFPIALRTLPSDKELLGVNINEMGRDAAAVKVVARMFNINFDVLWQRYEREQRRKRLLLIIGVVLFALFCLGVGGYIVRQNIELGKANREIKAERDRANNEKAKAEEERAKAKAEQKKAEDAKAELDKAYNSLAETNTRLEKANEELENANRKIIAERAKTEIKNAELLAANDSITKQSKIIAENNRKLQEKSDSIVDANKKIMENQAKLIADIANNLTDEGNSYLAQRLLSEVLPKDLNNPDKPYIPEVEAALRKAVDNDCGTVINTYDVITSIDFSPDGRKIVYGGFDGYYISATHSKIVGTTSISPISSAWGTYSYTYARTKYSPDGKHIITLEDGQLIIRDAETLKIIDYIDSEEEGNPSYDIFYEATYSANGEKIYCASSNEIKIFNASSLELISNIKMRKKSLLADNFLSIDESKIIYYKRRIIPVLPLLYYTSIWKPIIYDIHKKKQKLINNKDYCRTLTYSANGDIILTATKKAIQIYDTNSYKEIANIKAGKGKTIKFAEPSPDGKTIAVASDSIVRLYDVNKGIITNEYRGHKGEIMALAFDHNGEQLASSSTDGTIRIWKLHKQDKSTQELTSVSYNTASSRDGKYIAYISSNPPIYDGRLADFVSDGKSWLCIYDIEGKTKMMEKLLPLSVDDPYLGFSDSSVTVVINEYYRGDLKKRHHFTYSFPPLQDLIDKTRKLLKEYPLSPEERRKYLKEDIPQEDDKDKKSEGETSI